MLITKLLFFINEINYIRTLIIMKYSNEQTISNYSHIQREG